MLAAKFFRSLFTKEATPRRSQAVRLGLDNLERRDVPSGTVTGALSRNGKTWTITGDADANDITINPTGAGQFTVYGDNNTIIAGVTDPTGVENIVLKLGDGDDKVTVNNNQVPGHLAGTLTIQGGNGANYVRLEDMVLGKNLTITNGTNTSGQDQNYIKESSINGNVTIANGHGDTRTELYRDGPGSSTIGGALRIVNGTGYDYNLVRDVNFISNVLVRNGMPNSDNKSGTTQFWCDENAAPVSILGNLIVSYSGGSSGLNSGGMRDSFHSYQVHGNVTYRYNGGVGDAAFDGYALGEPARIMGNLTIKATGALAVAVARTGGIGAGLIVDGKLTISTGGANDGIRLNHLTVGGRTAILTGAGDDWVSIDNSQLAQFYLNTNKGNDRVYFDYYDPREIPTLFTGITVVHLGMGDDEMILGYIDNPNLKVIFGDTAMLFGDRGNDTITAYNVLALNNDPITILE